MFSTFAFFQHAKGQKLEPRDMDARLEFSIWLEGMCALYPDFPQIIIFGDEKYFLLEQPHNSRNVGTYAAQNPFIISNIKKQGATKVFCFVIMVDGKVLPPVWIDKDPVTKKVSMNGTRYLKEVKKLVRKISRDEIDRKGLWWQQGNNLLSITLQLFMQTFLVILLLLLKILY